MRLLVTGGRDYHDYNAFLLAVQILPKPDCIIHGNAKGADNLADKYGLSVGIPVIRVPAEWDYYGNAAGMIRNEWMITLLSPTYCMALPGGRGTSGMVNLCIKNNIPVWKPYS